MTVEERLEKIEAMLVVLVERQAVREWYTTHEFARMVGKAEFTIREYCRLGRLRAEKRGSGRGAYPAWVISQSEFMRFQRDGLLPGAAHEKSRRELPRRRPVTEEIPRQD